MDSVDFDETDEVPSNSTQNSIVNDESSDVKEFSDPYHRPTFKNTTEAKKRLKAFGQPKRISISPNAKEKLLSEHNDCRTSTKSKKEHPMDRAKATVEEIELLKMSEFPRSSTHDEKTVKRSRSKSIEPDFVFRKRDIKVRNYRRSDHARRSPSPIITTAKSEGSRKSHHNYPRNWEEFKKDKWNFNSLKLKFPHNKNSNSNDIFRQLLFEAPPCIIRPGHYINERGDDLTVPLQFLRITSAKPRVPYSANIFQSRAPFLTRSQVLSNTCKEFKEVLTKFYSRSGRRCKTSEPMGQRNWFPKNWKDSDSKKILETSIGLSFLQTYSDEEEEDDQQFIDLKETIEPLRNFPQEKKTEKNKDNFDIEKREISKEEINDSPVTEVKNERKKQISISSTDDKIHPECFPSTSNEVEENVSWTPERKPSSDNLLLVSHLLRKQKPTLEDEKNKIKTGILEEDKLLSLNDSKKIKDKRKKKKKRSKQNDDNDSPSHDEHTIDTKKKRKLIKKKKHKEKDKKTKKKDKLKISKALKEKKKQREKEKKDILKKLKKEIEQKLENEKISNIEEKKETIVKVKKEKDLFEDIVLPSKQIENITKEKEINKDNRKKKDKNKQSKTEEDSEKAIDKKIKKEKSIPENIKHKERKENEEIRKKDNIVDERKIKCEKVDKEEMFPGEETPDTEEYQSNWESDDGITPYAKPPSKKCSRGWESDEELFERSFPKKETSDVSFAQSPVLEMPLDIKLPRRRFTRIEKKRSRTRSPEYLDMEKEIKLLAAERMNLNKERMQLEMERMRIHELERKKSIEEMEQRARENYSPIWHENQISHDKWFSKEDSIDSTSRRSRKKNEDMPRKIEDVPRKSEDVPKKHEEVPKKHEDVARQHEDVPRKKIEAIKPAVVEIVKPSSSGIVVTVHSSPEITSTKSPTHTVLENQYQEFMKAVSFVNETTDIVISSDDSVERHIEEKPKKAKVKQTKSQRDKNRERSKALMVEEVIPVSTTDPKILQEILLPDEMPIPELPPPGPVPVPSPSISSVGRTVSYPESEIKGSKEVNSSQDLIDSGKLPAKLSPMKPFSFSTLVIPTKKSLLVEKVKWKMDDDSDEEVQQSKKPVDVKVEESTDIKEQIVENKDIMMGIVKKDDVKVEIKEESTRESEKKGETEDKREEKAVRRRHSRSPNALDSREKRRKVEESRKKDDENRKREDENRRREDQSHNRDDDRRRDLSHRRGDETRRKLTEEEARRRDRDRAKRPVSPLRRKELSPRRKRSPIYRRSPGRSRFSPRRTETRRPEREDRRSPVRCSPIKRKRSHSPTRTSSAPRKRSASPRAMSKHSRLSKSPRRSPMEGLKRSVADSTISDDLLPQPYPVDSSSSPLCSSTPAPSGRRSRANLSPKRPSLDDRINQVLGIESTPQPTQTWSHTENDVQQRFSYPEYHHNTPQTLQHSTSQSSKVLQVGNILQVVPSDDLCIPYPPEPLPPPSAQKILQVGNMLQIVPSDMIVEPIIPPLPPPEPPKETPPTALKSATPLLVAERQSAETVLVERMAENARKRLEKEERRKEKERKKKDKVKKKKMRLKVTTEEMIKRALELDGYIGTDNEDLNAMIPEIINDSPGLDPSRSILSTSTNRFLENALRTERERKSVQFADGVKPGEGTSPSGGEELASPPPQTDVILKPKKYKRIGSAKKKKKKKKTKAKTVKRPALPPPPTASDEEYENLPPPSPPPGSPPPSVFPPRAKVHTINNIPQHYLPAYGIPTMPQTPPMVQQPPPRLSMTYQAPPTAMYTTPPPPVPNQHYQRMGLAAPINMSRPPPTAMHRDHQQYGAY